MMLTREMRLMRIIVEKVKKKTLNPYLNITEAEDAVVP